jgi:hypothetical protein
VSDGEAPSPDASLADDVERGGTGAPLSQKERS